MGSQLATATPTATAAPLAARTIEIVIADDHGLFRAGLRGLLESESDFRVVGEATNDDEAVEAVQALNPDVLLLDLCIARLKGSGLRGSGLNGSGSGLNVLRALVSPPPRLPARDLPPPRTIVLTAAIDDDQTIEALRLGAQGILLKDSAPSLLFKSIRAVADGQCWLGRERVSHLVRHLQTTRHTAHESHGTHESPRRTAFGLTPRERQVVSAIVDGSTNRDIAERYSVSADTVKHHLTNIFDKCGVSTRLELALFAVHHRLVDPP